MRCGGPPEPDRGRRHVWRGGGVHRHGARDARGPRATVARPGGRRWCARAAAAAGRCTPRTEHDGQRRPTDAIGHAATDAIGHAAASRARAAAGDASAPACWWGGRSRRPGRRASGASAAAQSDDAAIAPTDRPAANAAPRTGWWHGQRHARQRDRDAAAVVPASERESRRAKRIAAVAAQRDQPPADTAGAGRAHGWPHAAGAATGAGDHAAHTGTDGAAALHAADADAS